MVCYVFCSKERFLHLTQIFYKISTKWTSIIYCWFVECEQIYDDKLKKNIKIKGNMNSAGKSLTHTLENTSCKFQGMLRRSAGTCHENK